MENRDNKNSERIAIRQFCQNYRNGKTAKVIENRDKNSEGNGGIHLPVLVGDQALDIIELRLVRSLGLVTCRKNNFNFLKMFFF